MAKITSLFPGLDPGPTNWWIPEFLRSLKPSPPHRIRIAPSPGPQPPRWLRPLASAKRPWDADPSASGAHGNGTVRAWEVQKKIAWKLDMDGNGWSIDCNMLWKKGEKIDSQLAGRFIVLTCFKNCFHFGHEWDHLAVKSKSGGYFLICGVGKFSELFWGVVVQENNCFLGWNLRRLSSSWWFQVSTLLGPWCQICGGSPHESEVGYTSPVT